MVKEEFFNRLNKIFNNLNQNPINDVYRVVGEEFGYFDLPKKRSLADLYGFKVLYRGFSNKTYIKDFLEDDNNKFFIGSGNFGDGFYATEDEDIAKIYTYANSDYNKSNILKIYIKDVNIIEYHYLIGYIYNLIDLIRFKNSAEKNLEKNQFANDRARFFFEFVEMANKENRDISYDLMCSNMSAMAIILGFDVIDLSQTSDREPNCLILNRSKVHVLDVDYDRILGESKRFKPVYSGKVIANQKGE